MIGVLDRLCDIDVRIFDRVGNLTRLAFVLSDFLGVSLASLLLLLLLDEIVTGSTSGLIV